MCFSGGYNLLLHCTCSWLQVSTQSSEIFTVLWPYCRYLWISFCNLIDLHIFHKLYCRNPFIQCMELLCNYHCCVSIWQHVYGCLSFDLRWHFGAIFLQNLEKVSRYISIFIPQNNSNGQQYKWRSLIERFHLYFRFQ